MEHIAILEKYGHCEEDIFSLTQHIENLFPQITVLQKGLGILNNKLVSLETKEQELKKSQNEYIKAFSIETQRSNVLHKKSSQIKGQQEYNKNKEQKAISQKFIEFYRTGTDEIGLLIKAIVEKKEEISAIYKENENKIAVQQEDKKIQSEKLNKKLEIHLKEKKELEKSIDSEILGEVIYLQKKKCCSFNYFNRKKLLQWMFYVFP